MDSLIQFTFPVLELSGKTPRNVIVKVRFDSTDLVSVVEIDQNEISGTEFKNVFIKSMTGTLIDVQGYLLNESTTEKIYKVLNTVEALNQVVVPYKF